MATIEIISRETIKPSSPTPSHLRNYKFSLLDQLTVRIYMPMLYFYPDENPYSNIADKACRLKNSLSRTLTRYYPFAGRFTEDGLSIDCNDMGVDFLVTRIHCQMSQVLEDNNETQNLLCPTGVAWSNCYDGCLVIVQLNFFQCGGTVVSVCMTHKIADALTTTSFMTDWAMINARRQPSEEILETPLELITRKKILSSPSDPLVVAEMELDKVKCITRRFVFCASKIAKLKAMTADHSGVPNPTTVEVVTALLYKCAMAAYNENMGSFKPSVLLQLVNMRSRVIPPLPEDFFGNFCWYFSISTADESGMKLNSLVGKLRNGIAQLCDKKANNLKVHEWLLAIRESAKESKLLFEDIDFYKCTSACGLPFYSVDFGWGKPVLVRMSNGAVKNLIFLMDTPEGNGVEAWVTLEEQVMKIFQHDKELLQFTSLNPSVTILSSL